MMYISSFECDRHPAVAQFLCEVIALQSASPPPPWLAFRNQQGVLLFKNSADQTMSDRHPLEHVLQLLAQPCRECLQLDSRERYDYIMSW